MKTKPSSVMRKDSRFTQGGTATVTKKTVGWWERDADLTIRADDDIIIFSLPMRYDGRPDLLSFDLYGSNNLEWVILQYNNIVDINEEFVQGARLEVPSPERLFSSILIRTLNYEESNV